MDLQMKQQSPIWPVLDWEEWQETAETLQLFLQIVGKTRLALTPMQNHWWNVPLYVTARGLSTSVMPLPGGDLLEIEFDFIRHEINFRRGCGENRAFPLQAQTVADFYAQYQRTLASLGVTNPIRTLPVECKDPICFDEDRTHKSYDAAAAHRFWRALCLVDTVFKRFSTNFHGKISPVHFFWGSFDLACTRFNGRKAPARLSANAVQAEAYSHECISAGFWPGNGGYGQAAFYCYAAPVPKSIPEVTLACRGTFNKTFGEFLLNYDEVRSLADPAKSILEFLQSTYSACADAGHWDRGALDRTDVAL